ATGVGHRRVDGQAADAVDGDAVGARPVEIDDHRLPVVGVGGSDGVPADPSDTIPINDTDPRDVLPAGGANTTRITRCIGGESFCGPKAEGPTLANALRDPEVRSGMLADGFAAQKDLCTARVVGLHERDCAVALADRERVGLGTFECCAD